MTPRSCSELFWAFSQLALQGFGGVLAVAQRELVERRQWMTAEEFLQETALAQALPGPNVVNLALAFGDRHFGWRGALAALAGLMGLPLVIILGLVIAYGTWAHEPLVQGALWGMGAVSAGLIGGTALRLLAALAGHPLGRILPPLIVLAVFGLLALLRWPIAGVIVGLGGASVLATAWALGRKT